MAEEGAKGATDALVAEEVEKKEEVAISAVDAPVTNSIDKNSGAASIQTSVNDALSLASKWSGTAFSSVQGAFSALDKWKDRGTPIREGVKAVRLGLNDTLVASRAHYSAMEESIQDKVATSKAHTEAMFSNLGIQYSGIVELRRKHPEVLVGGATLAVALPSSLRGRRAMVKNGVLAFVWSAGIVYGLNWWDRRSRRPGSRSMEG